MYKGVLIAAHYLMTVFTANQFQIGIQVELII